MVRKLDYMTVFNFLLWLTTINILVYCQTLISFLFSCHRLQLSVLMMKDYPMTKTVNKRKEADFQLYKDAMSKSLVLSYVPILFVADSLFLIIQ